MCRADIATNMNMLMVIDVTLLLADMTVCAVSGIIFYAVSELVQFSALKRRFIARAHLALHERALEVFERRSCVIAH